MAYKLYDAEIEYLEGTGTQYINLGTTLNSSTDVVDIEFCMTQGVNGAYKLFGARSGASEKNYSIITSNPNGICIDLQNAAYSTYRATYTYEVGVYYAVHMERTLRRASSNGVTIAEKTNESQSFTTAANAYLFSFNQSGNNWMLAPCRIKSLAWRRNNLNFIDLIPVRVGNVGYMYDKVSGRLFGNAGTGSFVLGPDVAPAAYANEIAFLESTGSQYIDTGILNNDNIVIETTMSAQGKNCLNGSEASVQSRFKWGSSGSGGGYYGYQNQNISFGNVLYLSKKYTFHLEKGNQYVVDCNDGTTVASSNAVITQYSTYPIYLFHLMSDGSFVTQDGIIRIFSCKIWQNDTLVRDFIPVEYNNIGYLYDKVSGEFFANQGTGKFVLGHRAPRFDGKACARSYTRRQLLVEVGQPTYIQDGLVFWLDGIDKGASNGTWVEKIHGTIFSGNATSVDKGFNFSSGQRMSGSWVNGTSTNFTVEVCYYTATTGKHFVWGAGLEGTKTPLYYDNAGAITTIQNLNTFQRPTTIVPNKTVSINQDRGIYNGISISKNAGTDWWVAAPNATTAYIGKGYAGVASATPLTGTIYAIRVYNRKLSANEMLYNQRADNKRFNLGLNI